MTKIKFAFFFLIIIPIFSLSQNKKPLQAKNHATILFDAFSKDTSLSKGWGYSSLIQFNGKSILFDAGSNADTFSKNVTRLGVNLKKIDFVVVSHAHFDHLNGIDYLLSVNPKVKIFFPADMFWGAPSSFNAKGQDSLVRDSLPVALRYFDGKGQVFNVEQSGGRFLHANIEFVKDSKEILPGIRLIATEAKYMGYFSKYPKGFVPGSFTEETNNVKYSNLPELSLSLNTEKGEILFVGCSHSGVENIIRETMNITGKKIEMVLGGFHLIPFDRTETSNICNMIKNTFQVNKVAPGHCTGHLAFKILSDLYNDKFIYAGLGERIDF